jgi:hypothetical protein
VALGAVLALVLILSFGGGSQPRRRGPGHAARPPAGPLRTGPPARPAPGTQTLGVNIGLLFNLRTNSQAEINAQISALARTGAQVVRADAPWEASEPRPPVGGVARYDWSFDDGIAAALAAHRLRWLPIIDYSPPWVRSIPGVDHSAPASPAAYAAYAGALAARYGAGGSFWRGHPRLHPEPVETYEIWNEPDSVAFWRPQPAAAAYGQLYLRARASITSVQRQARVIIGGLTRPVRFLPALLSAEPALRGHVDGVGIHPYGRNTRVVLTKVRRARITLRSLGMAGVPMYVTEIGWRTQPIGGLGYAPSRKRPRLIFQTLTALRNTDCGIAAIFLYAWFTPDVDAGTAQVGYGIDPFRPRRTPAVRALTRAFSPGVRASAAARLCSTGAAHS